MLTRTYDYSIDGTDFRGTFEVDTIPQLAAMRVYEHVFGARLAGSISNLDGSYDVWSDTAPTMRVRIQERITLTQ